MLITPDKLKLVKYLDEGNRPETLDCLFFDQNKAVVCNGHYLIQVEDIPPPHEDFPVVKGMIEGPDYVPDKTLVTAKTATKVLKNLPKSKILPILNNALINVDKDDNVSFGLIDRDSSTVICQHKKEGEYPDIDTTIPWDEPGVKVNVNVKYLQKIAGALNEFLGSYGAGQVEIAIQGSSNTAVFRCEKDDATMIALIMPLQENKD